MDSFHKYDLFLVNKIPLPNVTVGKTRQDRPITSRWETGSEEHGDVLNCLFRTVNMAAKRWPYFSGIFSVFFLSELG